MAVLREKEQGSRLEVTVQPKARRSEFCGLHAETLKIALDAPPVDGKANEALRRFLADFSDTPISTIIIERGEKSRRKCVHLTSITPEAFRNKLAAAGIALPAEAEERSRLPQPNRKA